MEEDNNNENQVKETIKNESKKLAKKAVKPFMKYIVIGVAILFGILLTVGLLHLVEYQVKSIFTNLINTFSINSSEDAEHIDSDTNDSVIYIDTNGYYKLKENYSELILEKLEEQKVNNKVMGFDLENNEDKKMFRDMIDKYIKAEVETTFPKTGKNFFNFLNEVDGNITLKRATINDNGTKEIKDLKYKKYSDFCSLVEGDYDDALNYFSINPEDFKLCIARSESKTEYWNIDANGNESLVHTEGGGIAKEELDYRTYMENYAVPLNFLITMHLISQDVDFMNELVELATGANKTEPLVLTYVDSEQQYTTIYNYEGTDIETVKSFIDTNSSNYDPTLQRPTLTEDSIKGLGVGSVYSKKDINNDNAFEYYSDAIEYEKQVTTTYSGKLYITKTDTWLKTSERTVTPLPDDVITTGPTASPIEKSPIDHTYSIIKEDEESLQTVISKIMATIETINMTESVTSISTSKEFSVVDSGSEIVVQDFIDLIEKYPEVKNRISTAPSNIFYLLQQNENTQKLEKIMRYVLYVLNDIDYGVTEADLDFLLEDESFISPNGGIYNGGTVEETIWFTLLSEGYSKASTAGVLGNIKMESGFRTNNLEDDYEIGHKYSLGYTDKSYTDAVNSGVYSRQSFISDHINENCGAGYGLLQWTYYTRKAALYDLAKNSGRGIDDVNVQVELLLKELSGIKQDSVWRTTDDPKEAARVLCKGFVNPGEPSEGLEKRAQFAQKYYDEFKDKTAGNYEPGGGGSTLYTGTYTSTRGRKFTILNQNTISGWGNKCNRAAAAIIASGYTDQDAATLINTLNTKYAQAGDTIVPRNNFFNLYGLSLTSESGAMGVSQYSEVLRNQLKSGGYAMVWVQGSPYYGASGTKWTGQMHWLAILDYRVSNGKEQIVIADWRGAGWYDIGEFKNGISRIALINEM